MTPNTPWKLGATNVSETGICPTQFTAPPGDLHHLPSQTIPWPPSIVEAKAQHFLMLCPTDTHPPMASASRYFPPEFLSMRDTSASRSEKGPYGSENPFQNHSPGFAPAYALWSHLPLPLQNTYRIISICLLIGHPQEAINFMEKKLFCL